MSTAHEVLAEVKAARLRSEAEDLQGQLEEQEPKLLKQGQKSRLPQVSMVFLSLIGLAVLVLFTIDFFKNPTGDRGWRGFALPIFSVLYMGIVAIQVQARHAKALAELIRLKAPDLHEELKNKGVL